MCMMLRMLHSSSSAMHCSTLASSSIIFHKLTLMNDCHVALALHKTSCILLHLRRTGYLSVHCSASHAYLSADKRSKEQKKEATRDLAQQRKEEKRLKEKQRAWKKQQLQEKEHKADEEAAEVRNKLLAANLGPTPSTAGQAARALLVQQLHTTSGLVAKQKPLYTEARLWSECSL